MARRTSPPTRIDAKFEKDLKAIAKIRLDKGLAKMNPRDLSFAEMTRLMRRTKGYPGVLEELKTKPRKEDNLEWRV